MSFRARVTREDDEDDENEDARAQRRAMRTSTRRFVVRMNADIVELTSVIVSEASDTGVVSMDASTSSSSSSSSSEDDEDDDVMWRKTRVHASVSKYASAANGDDDDADDVTSRAHGFMFRDALVGIIDALAREDVKETPASSSSSPAMASAASHVWALRRAARRARGQRAAMQTSTSTSIDDVRQTLRRIRDECDAASDTVCCAIDGYASKTAACAREGAKKYALEAAAVTADGYVSLFRNALVMREAMERGDFERACDLKDCIDLAVRSMSAGEGFVADGTLERAWDEGCRCALEIRARAKRLVTGWFTRARDRARDIGRAAIAHSVARERKLAVRAARIEACARDGLVDTDADVDADVVRTLVDDLDPSSVFRAHALCVRLGETPEEFCAWMRAVRAEQLKRDAGTPVEGAIGHFIIQLALVDEGVIVSRAAIDAEWAITVRELRANVLRTDGVEASRVAAETSDACACASLYGFDAGALLDAARALEIMYARGGAAT